ncbi:MAG: hypothetical protein ACOH2K_11800 [Burkholderiaceae bacterium]
MAHEVLLGINSKFVLHKDVKVEVSNDEGKLGTLLISKGNIEWLSSSKSVNKHRLSWVKFAELMVAQGKPARAKPKAKSKAKAKAKAKP